MIAQGEQELICDLAETYQIYNYRAMPVRLVATLSAGLRDDSRIMMKLRGEKYSRELTTLAMILDGLTILRYQLFNIKDQPKLMCELLYPDESDKAELFDSLDDFRAEWNRITNGGQ